MEPTIDPEWNRVKAGLRSIWGFERFRSPQDQVVRSLLAGRDCLVTLPTGGGKSICFQLPALLQTGVTLVVSPLVALMENQVADLARQRLPVAALHSELSRDRQRQIRQALSRQALRLLYLSPETLLSEAVWSILVRPDLIVRGLILDEAHCLVQWGDSFRPAYRRLGIVRSTLADQQRQGPPVAIAAFTATADPAACATLSRVLGLQNPARFQQSVYRPNLHLAVKRIWSAAQRRQVIRDWATARPGQAGLVYVRTRQDSETLAAWLGDRGLRTAAYHAGLAPPERRAIEAQWLAGTLPFVICTNAFGLGINKPDVRWVLHYQAPVLAAEYLQEIGRAGRDRQRADILLLASERTGWLDPSDDRLREYFLEQRRQQYRQAARLAQRLPSEGELTAGAKGDRAIALALLHASDRLTWLDPFHYHLTDRDLPKPDLQAFYDLKRYVNRRTCRWLQFRQQMGESIDPTWRCGHCDRCQSGGYSR